MAGKQNTEYGRRADPTEAALADLEARIAAVYGQAAREVSQVVADYFAGFRKRDQAEQDKLEAGEISQQQYKQWRLAQMGRGQRFQHLADQLAARMTEANQVAAAYMNDATPGIYSLNRNYAAYTIEQQVGADIGFTLWDEQTVRRLMVEEPDLLPYYPPRRAVRRGIDLAYGKQQVTNQVRTGILMGESIPKLASRIQQNIPRMNRDSAIRAARTAVTAAQNGGRYASYQRAVEMGIDLKARWIATLDLLTRPSHALLDGQEKDIGEPFVVDGKEILYPGYPLAVAQLIYNCRCRVVGVVQGTEGSSQRSARNPITGKSELVPQMTYSEWLEKKKQQYGEQAIEAASKKAKNKAADRKQFKEYQAVLGKNAPKTFEKFQELKYNKGEEWGFIKLDYRRRNELKNHPETVLPHAEKAKIPDAKFTKYLFNPENPKGWAKGQAFISRLGYSEENYKSLQAEIRSGAKKYPAVEKEADQFGKRYEQQMILYGKLEKPANVVVGWICKPDGSTNMTTAYIKEVKP